MQINISSTCESLDLTLPVLTPRSRLYSLEPVGIGTELVESLTGYIARLADAHHLSVAMLFGYELAPLACKEYLRRATLRSKYPCRILASAFLPQARAMNGAGVGASEWVQILQTLTLRTELQFLTMLFWKPVLSQGQLLRPTRAWCPLCYEQWRVAGKTIHEPLLWAIKAVTICPQHYQPLRIICGYCQNTLHLLTSRSRPGFCSICGMWLGETLGKIAPSYDRCTRGETDKQIWAATSIGQLLAVAPRLKLSPVRGNILNSLKEYLKSHVGSLPALAKSLGVNTTTLWQWYKGKNLPRLELLLRLCYQFGVSLLDFISGRIIYNCAVNIIFPSAADVKETSRSTRRRRINLDKAEAERVLQVASKEIPPPCVTDVSNRLSCDAATLRKHYPDLCQEISARYEKYRKIYWAQIKAHLQTALTEYPPVSVLKVSKSLTLSKSSLYKHFPTLCHQLAARYRKYRQRCFIGNTKQILKDMPDIAIVSHT